MIQRYPPRKSNVTKGSRPGKLNHRSTVTVVAASRKFETRKVFNRLSDDALLFDSFTVGDNWRQDFIIKIIKIYIIVRTLK